MYPVVVRSILNVTLLEGSATADMAIDWVGSSLRSMQILRVVTVTRFRVNMG